MNRVWRWISPVSVVIGLGFFAIGLSDVADGDWDRLRTSAVHQLWLPVLLMVVSVGVRSRTTYHLIAAALGGYFTSFWIAYAFGNRSADWLGSDDPWHLVVATPAIEEIAKAIPLLIVAWSWRRRDARPGIFDLGLLGVTVGAAFALREDAIWGRLASSGTDGTLGLVAPSFHTDTGFVIGHAGWTGIVGLAIGFAMSRRSVAGWLAPAGALVLVGADHGWWNNTLAAEDYRWLLVDGAVPAGVLFGGLALALVADVRARRGVPAAMRFSFVDLIRFTSTGPLLQGFRRWQDGSLLLRATTLAGRAENADWTQQSSTDLEEVPT